MRGVPRRYAPQNVWRKGLSEVGPFLNIGVRVRPEVLYPRIERVELGSREGATLVVERGDVDTPTRLYILIYGRVFHLGNEIVGAVTEFRHYAGGVEDVGEGGPLFYGEAAAQLFQ